MPSNVVTTGVVSGALKNTLLFAFRNEAKKTPLWKSCGFKEINSKDLYEDVTEFATLGPAPVKKQGAQMSVDMIQQGYTKRVVQVAYAIMMPVAEEAIRFNKYREAIMGAESIAESLRLTQELKAAEVFANAFSTTSEQVHPDGKALCATDHALPKGGTYQNAPTTATSLSHTSLEQIMQLCRTLPGGNGYPMGVVPQLLVLHSDLQERAERILMSPLQNDTANHTHNTLKGKVKVVGNPYFASTTNWFIITDHKYGLHCIWTQRPEFREHSVETSRTKVFDGYEMFAMDVFDPRGVIGINA